VIPRRIEGANRRLTAPADWNEAEQGKCFDLHVRLSLAGGVPIAESAWEPTPEELAILNAGGSIVLRVVGGQPPVWLSAEPL